MTNIPTQLLIISPISNRAKYLPTFLSHILNLNYPSHQIHLYFLVNNSIDDSLKILNNFKQQYQYLYASITIENFKSKLKFKDERVSKTRLQYTYSHLSDCRNHLLSQLSDKNKKYSNVTHLLSIDSDIMVPTDTLTKLLSHQLPIVSGLIYNGYLMNATEPWRFPNIMRKTPSGKFEHIANSYVKNAPNLTESKLIPVDLTGAIVLMSREVCQKSSYNFHIQGEDAAWSLDCADKGYKLFCDLSAFSFHCMNEKLLSDYIDKNNTMGELL